MTSNADIVVDQFTRQAAPFANSAAMRDEDALRLLVEFSGAGADDTVLDVACGPGLSATCCRCHSRTGHSTSWCRASHFTTFPTRLPCCARWRVSPRDRAV
jgi:hypothetical protein